MGGWMINQGTQRTQGRRQAGTHARTAAGLVEEDHGRGEEHLVGDAQALPLPAREALLGEEEVPPAHQRVGAFAQLHLLQHLGWWAVLHMSRRRDKIPCWLWMPFWGGLFYF